MPPININNSTTTFTKVAASTTVATLAAENGRRVGLLIFNNSAVDLYVRFDAAATSADFTLKIPTMAIYEMPKEYFTDSVTGILASGTGNIMVTEISK